MKRALLMQGLLAALLLALPAPAQAGTCPAAASLKGGYGLDLRGWTVAGQAYAAVGVLRLRGGGFSLDLTRSVDGTVSRAALSGSASGTDCSFTLAGDGFFLSGQIVGQGQTILVSEIDAPEPVVASGQLRRIGLNKCSTANLRGTYAYVSQGYERPAGPGTAIAALGKIGQESFDGKGCSYYRETVKTGSGIATAGPAYLPYQVGTDCSFTLIDAGQPAFYGVMVDGGNSMPYLKITGNATRGGEYTRAPGSPKVPGVCPPR